MNLYMYDGFDLESKSLKSSFQEKKAFEFSKTPIDNYNPVSGIDVVYGAINNTGKDFKLHRDVAAKIYQSIGFSGLSELEKVLSVERFMLVSQEESIDFISSYYSISIVQSESMYQDFRFSFDEIMRDSRLIRFNFCSSFIATVLDTYSALSITLEAFFERLKNNYINFGVEELAKDSISGLLDYINSTGDFASNGLGERNLIFKPSSTISTSDSLVEKLDSIIRYGN